jgi:putative RNA 2'-phosphotransferase
MSNNQSKFLSLVLRHQPELIGIKLDDAGWVNIDTLLDAAAIHGSIIEYDQLMNIVRSSDKKRFAISDDGQRIRANQGHSVDVDLQLTAQLPPTLLYHGTVHPALESIRSQGLVRGQRHHVHMSADTATASKVGARRGKPVILTIRAAEMVAVGHVFFCSANGVWLVEHVPSNFIDWPLV